MSEAAVSKRSLYILVLLSGAVIALQFGESKLESRLKSDDMNDFANMVQLVGISDVNFSKILYFDKNRWHGRCNTFLFKEYAELKYTPNLTFLFWENCVPALELTHWQNLPVCQYKNGIAANLDFSKNIKQICQRVQNVGLRGSPEMTVDYAIVLCAVMDNNSVRKENNSDFAPENKAYSMEHCQILASELCDCNTSENRTSSAKSILFSTLFILMFASFRAVGAAILFWVGLCGI